MRKFKVLRLEDVNGHSGIGYVAEGVIFTDGEVVMRWTTATPSTAIYRNIAEMESLHGHEGRTLIEYEEK